MEDKKKLGFYKFGRFQSSEQDFKEVIDRKDFVSFGAKNDFPQELIRLYQTAAGIHQSLIDTKAQMTGGNGWVEEAVLATLPGKLFFKNRYSEDDLNQVAKKCSFDLAIFNGFFLNIVWDETGTKIAKIDHIPFERVRAEKCIDDDEVINWYVSRDWENYRKAENRPEWYCGFSPDAAQIETGEGKEDFKSQILPVFVYSPGMDFYTLPSYHATIDSIKSMYEANLFELKSIQNGFNAGMIIVNKGEYTEEEQEELYSEIQSNYTGADNAGDFIMMFAPDAESVPEIMPIELQNTAERFIKYKDSITENIIEGHQASFAVAGRSVSGKLGSSQEIEEQYSLFQKKVINPYQDLIQNTFQMLAEFNGIEAEFKLNKYTVLEDDENQAPVEGQEEAKARAQLRGSVGGVQGIIQIQTSVSQGLTDRDSAAALLELIYGFSAVDALRLLGNVEEGSGQDEQNNNEIEQ